MAPKFALFTKGSKLPLNKGFKNMFELLQSCAQPSKTINTFGLKKKNTLFGAMLIFPALCVITSTEQEVFLVSYSDRSMSLLHCQQFALNDNSSYTHRPISIKLHRYVA